MNHEPWCDRRCDCGINPEMEDIRDKAMTIIGRMAKNGFDRTKELEAERDALLTLLEQMRYGQEASEQAWSQWLADTDAALRRNGR